MQEEDVVVEQVGMDDARRQAVRPAGFEEVELRCELAFHGAVDVASRAIEQGPPAGDRQGIGPLELKVAAGKVQRGERFADRAAVPDGNATRR